MKAGLLITFNLILIIHSGCNNTGANAHSIDNANVNASSLTQVFYQNLKQVSQNNILFGHQDALAYGIGWKDEEFRTDVHDVTGNHPAVFGWDLGHIGDSMNIDGVSFERMKKWMTEVYYNNGINTISWHHRNPVTHTNCWDTTNVVSKILPGGELHNAFKNDLDLVAGFFNSLEDSLGNKIPVIFRPLHEMNGGWFWWGTTSCSDNEYMQLWQFIADYLKNDKEVHNILLCYSPGKFQSREIYLARYPGDDYVDILGLDFYFRTSTEEEKRQFIEQIETIVTLAREKDKIAALTETGYNGIPDNNWWTDGLLPALFANDVTGNLLYILVWRNADSGHFFVPYPEHSGANDFISFEKDPRTTFLNDMHDIYKFN